MQLYPFPQIEWSPQKAAQPGRCSLSGKPIKIGDPIYTTNEPSIRHYRVLIDEYASYEQNLVKTLG